MKPLMNIRNPSQFDSFPDWLNENSILDHCLKDNDHEILSARRSEFTQTIISAIPNLKQTVNSEPHRGSSPNYPIRLDCGGLSIKNIMILAKELEAKFKNLFFQIQIKNGNTYTTKEILIKDFDPYEHNIPHAIIIRIGLNQHN